MSLPRIKKGEVIRATFLNNIAEDVDGLTREFANRPRQVQSVDPGELQNQVAQDGGESEGGPNSFNEISRTVSQVQVFDQNDENYALIDRIDSITLANSLGDTMTLNFNNT